MAARKTNDQLEKELQDQVDHLSNIYVELIAKCGEEKNDYTEQHLQRKTDVKKQLEQLKRDLKFIRSMKSAKPDKKKERELERQQNDVINWVKKMPSSISSIVRQIPKQ